MRLLAFEELVNSLFYKIKHSTAKVGIRKNMAFNPLKGRVASGLDQSPEEFAGKELEIQEVPETPQPPKEEFSKPEVQQEVVAAIPDQRYMDFKKLDALPLSAVLTGFGAEFDGQHFTAGNKHKFSIKENKWFDVVANKGNRGAISMMKHVISTHNPDLADPSRDRQLFFEACKSLHDLEKNKPELFVVQEGSTPKIANVQVPHDGGKINWKELVKELSEVPLELVLEHLGATPNEDGQRGKWKLWKTGSNIGVKGQLWHDWNYNVGGYGGVDLLAYDHAFENRLNYSDERDRLQARTWAIKEMVRLFGADIENGHILLASPEMSKTYTPPFSMPHVLDSKIGKVRTYLHEKRGIPSWVIEKQIQAGLLFAGYPSDWKDPGLHEEEKITDDNVWVTFLAVNSNAAEMRAVSRTDQYAKILSSGSDKTMGGFLIKAEPDRNERKVVACEAAVDAMSYHAMYPGRIVASCMGVTSSLAAQMAIQAFEGDHEFILAFDNDQAGNEGALRFRHTLIEEIGEEEFAKYADKISYFDLGFRCLRECVSQGKPFYFDVEYNDDGKECVKLFQKKLYKELGTERVKSISEAGLLKYANVAKHPRRMQDPVMEARSAVDLISKNRMLYISLHDYADEKDEVKKINQTFQKEFFSILGERREEFEKDGRICYGKQSFAKDWNEYLNKIKERPKFVSQVEEMNEVYKEKIPKKKVKKLQKPD